MSKTEYYRGRDLWFDASWADEITPEFARWWLRIYGHPDDRGQVPIDEYFERMAFAFMGWQGHERRVGRKKTKSSGSVFFLKDGKIGTGIELVDGKLFKTLPSKGAVRNEN